MTNTSIYSFSLLSCWLLFFLPTQLLAQDEKLQVDGGIKTDSLVITDFPAFRAELTTDIEITTIANTTQTITSWTDIVSAAQETLFDLEDNFDPATGVFTVPKDGLYFFQVAWIFKGKHLGDDITSSHISVNGSTTSNCINGHFTLISLGNTFSTSEFARLTRTFSGLLNLKKGDEVDVRFKYTDSATVAGGSIFLEARSSFSGYLVAEID